MFIYVPTVRYVVPMILHWIGSILEFQINMFIVFPPRLAVTKGFGMKDAVATRALLSHLSLAFCPRFAV